MAYSGLNVGASFALGTVSCGNKVVERAVCLFCYERLEVSVLSDHIRSCHIIYPILYNCGRCQFKTSSTGDTVSHKYDTGHNVF